MMPAHHGQLGGLKALPVPFGGSGHRLGGINEPVQLSLAQIVQHVDSFIRGREVQIGSFPTHVLGIAVCPKRHFTKMRAAAIATFRRL